MQGHHLLLALAVLITVGGVLSQSPNSLDIDEGIKKVQESIPELENIPELKNFNSSKLPSLENVEDALKKKCEKEGAPETVDLIKEEQEIARSCVESYVNVTVIQEELDEASKTGSMDDVFAKYCRLWPDIYACFNNATILVRQCMDHTEEVAFNKTVQIVQELKEFMCFKDGDRLAMFVAEGGVECMQERKDGIAKCLNDTVSARMPDSGEFSITNMPMFLYSSKDCLDFDKIRVCVINELEKCKDSTPANIVDAFFKFLKKQMNCRAEESVSKVGAVENQSSAASLSAATVGLIVSVLIFNFNYFGF